MIEIVYITGDKHGNEYDLHYSLKKLKEKDILIITGDFGFIWDHDKIKNENKENKRFEILDNKNIDILFVDGNHENFDRLNKFPIVNKYEGKVHQISEHIFHLIRGEIYRIENKLYFCLGGAMSHDIFDGILDPQEKDFKQKYKQFKKSNKIFRVKNFSWWESEIPNEVELNKGLNKLKQYNNKVDYIITHQAPPRIESLLGFNVNNNINIYNNITKNNSQNFLDYLNYLYLYINYEHWYCGHYHIDQKINHNFTIIYNGVHKIK